MNYAIKSNKGLANQATLLLCSAMVVIMSGCNTTAKSWEITPETPDETIVFLGNPGAGKSSLLNSILQKNIFSSGISIGSGVTQAKQAHIHENRLYIDTPGLSDVALRKQAAQEIEKALKGDKNYKIVFVATLESGRISPADLETINTICEAIQAPFEYGIIFNKVHQNILNKFNQNNQTLIAASLAMLNKKPLCHLIIEKDNHMQDKTNRYLPADSKSRQALLNFIDNLPLNRIPADQVATVNDATGEERVKQMEIEKREAEVAAREAQAQQRDAEYRAREAEAKTKEHQDQAREAETRVREVQSSSTTVDRLLEFAAVILGAGATTYLTGFPSNVSAVIGPHSVSGVILPPKRDDDSDSD